MHHLGDIWDEKERAILGMHLSKKLSQRPLFRHLRTVSPELNSGLGWWSSLHLGLTSVPLSSILLQLTSFRSCLQSRYTFSGSNRGQNPAARTYSSIKKLRTRSLNDDKLYVWYRFGFYKYIVLESLTQARLYCRVPVAFRRRAIKVFHRAAVDK